MSVPDNDLLNASTRIVRLDRVRREARGLRLRGEIVHQIEHDHVMDKAVTVFRYEGDKPPYPQFVRVFRDFSVFADGQRKNERHTNMVPCCGSMLPAGYRKEIDGVLVHLYDAQGDLIPNGNVRVRLVMAQCYDDPAIDVEVSLGVYATVKVVRLESLECFEVYVGPLPPLAVLARVAFEGPLWKACV